MDVIQKEDLALVNHLSGKKGKFIKVSFKNVQDFQEVKWELQPIVEENKKKRENQEAYEGWYNPNEVTNSGQRSTSQFLSKIIDIREYDIAYHIRTCVDIELRCSFWYEVEM